MASSLSISDVSKLKVQDLKNELKARDLSTTGNKNELVARLEKALQVVVDAEALLEEPENEVDETGKVAESNQAVQKDVVAEKKELQTPVKKPITSVDTKQGDKKLSRAERFGVVSEDAAKAKRAARFGVSNEEDKKAARAAKFGVKDTAVSSEAEGDKKAKRMERFGAVNSGENGASAAKTVSTEEDEQKLLKRKAKFGETVSPKVSKVETDEKMLKRSARFGAVSTAAVTAQDEEKKKKRMERFTA